MSGAGNEGGAVSSGGAAAAAAAAAGATTATGATDDAAVDARLPANILRQVQRSVAAAREAEDVAAAACAAAEVRLAALAPEVEALRRRIAEDLEPALASALGELGAAATRVYRAEAGEVGS